MAVHGRGDGEFGFDNGITLLVLNRVNIARSFAPGGQTFRYMDNVVQEVARAAEVNVVRADKGYQTGALAASIGHSVTPSGTRQLQANVRATSPHAIYYHQGTRPHRIEPRRPLVRNTTHTRGMWSHPVGGLVFFWRRIGRWVRVPHVNHPGYRGNPFLTDAVSEVLHARGIKKL